jgi:hypothetical protein
MAAICMGCARVSDSGSWILEPVRLRSSVRPLQALCRMIGWCQNLAHGVSWLRRSDGRCFNHPLVESRICQTAHDAGIAPTAAAWADWPNSCHGVGGDALPTINLVHCMHTQGFRLGPSQIWLYPESVQPPMCLHSPKSYSHVYKADSLQCWSSDLSLLNNAT